MGDNIGYLLVGTVLWLCRLASVFKLQADKIGFPHIVQESGCGLKANTGYPYFVGGAFFRFVHCFTGDTGVEITQSIDGNSTPFLQVSGNNIR